MYSKNSKFISKSAVIFLTLCFMGLTQLALGSPAVLLKNYVIYDDLLDGQHETRVHYNGISAKQAYVGPHEGSPQ